MAVAVLPIDSYAEGDVSYASDGRIVEDRDLETAVFLSLFWDAPAQDGDDIPDGQTRRGFWADSLGTDGDVTGSRLWLLQRSKITDATLVDAKTFAEEALQWLIRDEIARSVAVSATRITMPNGPGILVEIVVYKSTGERFEWAWDALTGEAV